MRSNNILSLVLCFGLMLICSKEVSAVEVNLKARPLQGKDGGIAVDSASTVYDDVLVTQPGWSVRTMRNIITLKIDEFSGRVLPDSFSLTVIYKLDYKVWPSASLLSKNDTLVINYYNNKAYTKMGISVNPGVYYSSVQILSVSASYASLGDFIHSVMLENEIQSTRDYIAFDCNNNAIQSLDKDTQYVAKERELSISWPAVLEADEYDLEWAVIDEAAKANYYKFGTTNVDPEKLFDNNATRVTLRSEKINYRIPLLYEPGMIVYVRIRPVQVLSRGMRKEANWSSDYSGGMIEYNIWGGLEKGLNWQATTSYAEEGKRKSVVQFYDGSLRARQTVTKDNATNKTVVAETFYDYEGRPQIQVLPSPTLDSLIKYTPNFNLAVNGDEYHKDLYDLSVLDYCQGVAAKMNDTSGAAKYYSSNNPEKNTGNNQFIPNAFGYPFTETKYTQDGTGRIAEQGGVGAYHQLGQSSPGGTLDQGHQTKYYYGTADQEDLDALFGTEVGEASHYFKNMVRDANGQFSVSYVDMHGRTIATALAGTPAATKLSKLSSNVSRYEVKNLLSGGSNISKDKYTVESTKSLVVTKAGYHTFNYSLLGDSLTIADCDSLNICYDCLYDLEIKITDDCGNQKLPGDSTFTFTQSNFTLADFLTSPDTACNALTNLTWEQSLYLEEGVYQVTKTLSISQTAFNVYRDAVFLKHNTCKTLEQFIDSVKTAILSNISCETSCAACTDSVGTWETYHAKFMTKLGIAATDTAAYRDAAWKSYTTELSICDAICMNGDESLSNLLEEMLDDVSAPAGQYANDYMNDEALRYPWSVFKKDPIDPSKLKYQRPSTDYLEEDGTPSLIDGVKPQELDPVTFAANFKASWAASLLSKHPEYARYLRLIKFKNSFAWDREFESTPDYATAKSKGYLNPTANTSGAYTVFDPSVPTYISRDPFYTIAIDSFGNNNRKTLMHTYMDNVGIGVAIWNAATINAKCGDQDETCFTNYSSSNAFNETLLCQGDLDAAWRNFRDMYLAQKTKLLYEIVLQSPVSDIIPPVPNPSLAGDDNQHVLRILSPSDLDPGNMGGGASSGPEYQENSGTQILAMLPGNCASYAEQWLSDLGTCNYTNPQKEILVERLTAACINGGDINHPFGASTAAPGVTTGYRSFEQVVREFNQEYGITTNINCNGDLITVPLPYEVQGLGHDNGEYISGAPDSCVCSKLSELNTNYQASSQGFVTFAAYVKHNTGANMRESDLQKLLNICTAASDGSCNNLDSVIFIPPALQCTTDACIDCVQMKQHYKNFQVKYPNTKVLTGDSISSEQEAVNTLFVRYMNNRTGLNKTLREYLLFMEECEIDPLDTIPANPIPCDSLIYVLKYYRESLIPSTHDGEGTETGVWEIDFNKNERDLSGYDLKDFFVDSIFTMPEIEADLYKGDFKYRYLKPICVNDDFSVELRTRLKPGYDSTVMKMQIALQLDSLTFYASFATDADSSGFFSTSGLKTPIAELGNGALKLPSSGWIDIKLSFKNNRLYTYFDGKLQYIRNFNEARGKIYLMELLTVENAPMDIEFVKLYDQYNNPVYVEDFNEPGKLTKPPYPWICDKPDCETTFTEYFNERFGTAFTYNQIAALYENCGMNTPCKTVLPSCKELENIVKNYSNSLYDWGYNEDGIDNTILLGLNHYTAAGTHPAEDYRLKDFIRNGMFSVPDTVTVFPGDFSMGYQIPSCISGAYSIEARVRIKPGYNYSAAQLTFLFGNYSAGPTQNRGWLQGIFTGDSWVNGFQGSYYNPSWVPLGSYSAWPDSTMHYYFDEWKNVKFTFKTNGDVVCNVDNVFAGKINIPFQMTPVGFSILGWYNSPVEIDWFKLYNATGEVKMFEDFNDPSNFVKPPYEWSCNKPACESSFTTFFNQAYNTDYTYNEISLLYKSICGKNLGLCPPPASPKLCPTRDSFPEFNPPTKCDLAVNGATDLGTILFNNYQDSLKSVFEDNYLRKCLKIADRETFTVSDSSSEYHYTLYYYDQAGNLVKTIPPEGVNLSKMGNKITWSDSVKAARLAKTALPVQHALPTLYRYNSLNQVVAQNTPDAGISRFWYDRLGRLTISQNAKQRTANGTLLEANRKYSYTLYDDIGRITEVGEYTNTAGATMTQALSRNKTNLAAWLSTSANRREITRTIYDIPNSNWASLGAGDIPVNAQNLRNRVSYVQYYPLGNANGLNYAHATTYSYDIHGNVDTLVQDYGSYAVGTYRNIMNANGLHNRLKKTVYQYDLISGKVNHVAFQPQYRKGANIYIAADAMYHKYEYDAENRLIAVHTSTDSVVWERDAAYAYYKHGPLARTELGEQRVQGLDYAYTIQGWLKGVNSSSLDSSVDMGLDGFAGLSATPVPKDEFGFSLNYFNGDYSSIKEGVGSTAFPEHTQAAGISNGLATAAYQPLYNGNISSMAVNIGKLSVPDATGTGTTQGAVLYNYGYDQLNRLVSMDAYKGLNNSNNSWENMVSLPHYQERVAYDGNGNILKYKRNGNKTSQQVMDSLNYVYTYHTSGVLNGKLKHNQLKQVIDGVTNTAAYDESDPASGVSDIESQAANNYAYDSIGNLIKDTKENINSINWNVYGKISDINFAFVANKIKKITYGYDAAGNRISKMVEKYGASGTATATSDYTWYSRDASGNVMGVYTSTGSGTTLPSSVNVTERHLYGSRRLGILSETKDAKPLKTQSSSLAYLSTFIRGNKVFELSNHLGNVLATVSDKKKGIDNGVYELSCFPGFGCNLVQVSTDPDGEIDYYVADVISANDYYPGGMDMPGRSYGTQGRYGFNGKELDNEVVQYDYGFRIYDPRLVRFKSVDPLFQSYPWFSPYQFAGNSPILNIDLDGLENKPTQPNTQPQNPDERFKELYEKFKEVKPYIKDATKLAKVSWQFQAGVYAAKVITEGKILDIKSKIRTNNKELDKLTQELNADENGNQTKSDFKGFGGGSMGGGGASGTWEESPNVKPRVKTTAEIKREQTQKKIEALKKANESLEWDKQKYETVREGLNEFTMFGDVQDEVIDILKVVKDPTPENIKKYLEDKATQYVKDRLLDGLTKDKAKEKNKNSSKKSSNNSNTP